jgi:hypothetical protein
MAVSEQDLFLAILSMDSYNRGYGQGMILEGNSIGSANISVQSDIDEESPEVAAGFYAIAYNWNGKTVISYRGTDEFGPDIVNGYGIGAGDPAGIVDDITGIGSLQGQMALEFYNLAGGSSAVLTGHSLGGGLATLH